MKRMIFGPEHEQFRDSVRRFMQAEVGPHAEAWREAGLVPRELYLKAGAQGLLCTWADEKIDADYNSSGEGQVCVRDFFRFALATCSHSRSSLDLHLPAFFPSCILQVLPDDTPNLLSHYGPPLRSPLATNQPSHTATGCAPATHHPPTPTNKH